MDNSTHNSGRILRQIAGLLALSQNNPSQEEAASAAAKAQELMFKYNVELSDLEGHNEGQARAHIGHRIYDLRSAGKGGINWRRLLYFGISRANMCKAIIIRGRGQSYTMGIVGATHNVEIVDYLYTYLANEIWRLADTTFIRMKYREGRYMPNGTTWKDEYCMAAMKVVVQRLMDQLKANKAESNKNTALVVVQDRLVTEEFAKQYPRVNSGGWMGNTDRGGYATALGKKAGEEIALNRGIAGNTRSGQLKLGA